MQNVSSFEESGSPKESPTTLLWTYYYLAQHCDYKGEHQKAIADKVITKQALRRIASDLKFQQL